MLTVLISEAAGVKCLAGGVDGSKQFEHRVCKCLLLSVLLHWERRCLSPCGTLTCRAFCEQGKLLGLNLDTTGEK